MWRAATTNRARFGTGACHRLPQTRRHINSRQRPPCSAPLSAADECRHRGFPRPTGRMVGYGTVPAPLRVSEPCDAGQRLITASRKSANALWATSRVDVTGWGGLIRRSQASRQYGYSLRGQNQRPVERSPVQTNPSKTMQSFLMVNRRPSCSSTSFSIRRRTRNRRPQAGSISAGEKCMPRFLPCVFSVRPISSADLTSTQSPGCRPETLGIIRLSARPPEIGSAQ